MSISHIRRALLGVVATTTLPVLPTIGLSKGAEATNQSPPAGDPLGKPYDKISTTVAADKDRVRLLFTYDCPYCRRYHNGIIQWGNTLPSPLRFDAAPVLTSNSDNLMLAIYGRLLMQGLAPSKLSLYDYTMYGFIQGDPDTGQAPRTPLDPKDVLGLIAQTAEVSPKALQAFIGKHGPAIEKQLPNHAQMIQTYGLKATPSVTIGGRVVVNPDHAGGEPQQYLLLLNAMVSRMIQGGLDAL